MLIAFPLARDRNNHVKTCLGTRRERLAPPPPGKPGGATLAPANDQAQGGEMNVGKPKRRHTVEPVKDPVPRKEPVVAPEQPVSVPAK